MSVQSAVTIAMTQAREEAAKHGGICSTSYNWYCGFLTGASIADVSSENFALVNSVRAELLAMFNPKLEYTL